MGELVTPDYRRLVVLLWGILARRLTPQQVAALYCIGTRSPTTHELAEYLEVSDAQAANVTRKLYDEGFLRREKDGKSYRWSSVVPEHLTLALHRLMPFPPLEGKAAERVVEILQRRGSL